MIRIRPLSKPDKSEWRPLWDGYLKFYRQELPDAVTDAAWEKLLADQSYCALAAEDGDRLVGFAHLLFHASTWSTKHYCYLEDLYVSSDSRGEGVGRKLLEAAFDEARARHCKRVYWATEEGNSRARGLYDQMADLTEFVQYRRDL